MKIVRPSTLFALLLISLQLSASPVFAQSVGLELTAEEQAWIRAHPTIRVHNEKNWPPFNFNENGEPRGFSIDFMNLVASRVGLQVEYISGPSWQPFLDMIRTGELDVIANAIPTDEKREYMHFTSTFIDAPVAIVIDNSTTGINSFDDLRGRRVAVVEGYFQQDYMERKYPEAELILAEDILDCLYAVLEGRADAMVASYPTSKYLMNQHALIGLRIATISRDSELMSRNALAVRHDWPLLRDILQKGMDTLGDKEITALRQKWLGAESTDISTESKLQFTAEERAWISEHPVIRVHNEMDWPPYDFNENGEPLGFTIDFMTLVADAVGLQVEYISGPSWQQFLDMLRVGDLDVLSNLTQTDERRKYIIFTSTFIDQPITIVVNDTTTGISSLEDLSGKRVAVVAEYGERRFLELQYPEIELVLEKNVLDSLYAVVEGRADAMFGSYPTSKYLIDKYSLLGLRFGTIARDADVIASLGMGVRKDQPVLRDILQKGMDSLDEAEVIELRRKWLGVDTEIVSTGGTLKTVWWLVGGVLGLFLLLMLLNVVSRRFTSESDTVLQTGTLRFRIIIFGSLSIFVVLVAIVGWFALERINQKILHDVEDNLENVLVTTAERLEIWLDQQVAVLAQIAGNPILVTDVEGLLNVDVEAETLVQSNELTAIRITLAQFQSEFGLGFFIINRQGISVGSDRDNRVGTRNLIATQRPELLGRVLSGESLFVPPAVSEVVADDWSIERSTSLFIAVPIRRSNGEVIAVLAMELDPALGFSQMLQFSRVGESGESYAFDQTGNLMSASRFESDLRAVGLLGEGQSSILNIQIRDPGGNMTKGFRSDLPRAEHPLTLMAESAIAASADARNQRSPVQRSMDGYRDYRGVPVYGAWLWDGRLGLGLTSEIDVAEAMSTYAIVRLTSFGVLGVTLFLSLGGIVFVLVTGERTNKALIRARDELEDRVEERTRDLNAAKEQFSTLVENIPGAVYRFRFDENFTTIFYSEYFATLTGYAAKDFMSGKMNFGDMIHPDDRESVTKDLNDAVAAKKPFEHEFRIINRAGDTRWVSSHGVAVYDSDGNAEFGDGTMFDVTEQKRLERELAEAHERMSEELNVAHDIQLSMLPLEFPAFPDRQEFDIYALLQPAREVGGDFYDFFFINDRELCLIVGDVSGKGVPAALFMAVTKTMLKARAIDDPSPASVMTRVNNELSADNPACMFVTLFMAIVDVHSGKIRFTNAGHNPPYILRKSGGFDCLDQRHGPIIGAVEGVAYKESVCQIGEGDSLFIFTDGVTEAMDTSGQLYAEDRLEKFLDQVSASSAKQLTLDSVASVEEFAAGAEQADDITILTFTLQQSADTLQDQSFEITIKADMSEIDRVNGAFSEYAENAGLGAGIIQKVSISIDDLLNNIVSYGFDDPKGHEIEISATHANDRLVITVTDDGKPFNPFDRVGPDTTLSLEERDIGGLGVLLVAKLMDQCTYRRLRNRNVVTLTMATAT